MPIDFKRERFTFPSASGSHQILERDIPFASNLRRVETMLNGFRAEFTDAQQPLHRVVVDTKVLTILRNVVRVRVIFGLRNYTDGWNTPFEGLVDIVIIADRI